MGSLGLIIENIVMGWEFWVPVTILIGIATLWTVSFSEQIDYGIRRIFYFLIAALLLFYHGIHKTSLFDIALTVSIAMTIYSTLNSVHMMNTLLLEYAVLLFIHFINLPGGEAIVWDRLTVSRLLMNTMVGA